jgi:hypothetical protein
MAWGASMTAGAALLVLLFSPLASAAPPPPITSGGVNTPEAFASPHEIAFDAVDRIATADHRVPNELGGSIHFTSDQMLAVMLEVHRATLFPSRAAEALAAAQEFWSAAEVAYNLGGKFYDSTLDSRSVCVPVEPNAWALQAADRLANATGRADVRARAADLAQTLNSALNSGLASGIERCDLPPPLLPVPLWSLLLHYDVVRDGASRTTALNQLDREMLERYEGGFHDGTGLYLAATNAQYLLVLQAAERASPGKYASTRDEMATLLSERLATASGTSLLLRNAVRRDGALVSQGAGDPLAQVWAAYALHGQATGGSRPVPDAPQRLLQGLLDEAWSPDAGAFVLESGRPRANLNLLVALFTAGPSVTQVSAEGARVALVVPARAGFAYPDPSDPESAAYLISNEWTFRFALDPYGPTPQPVAVPVSRIGPVRHVFQPSPYAPLPQLQRAGDRVDATTEGRERPILRFNAVLQPVSPFRLLDYAPVLPVASELQRDLRLFLVLNSSEPVLLDLLRVDVAVSNVTVESVRFNDALLDASGYTASDVSATEFLSTPHLRLELHGVMVRPDLSNELFVSYADLEQPQIGEPVFSTDPNGVVPLKAGGEAHNEYSVSTKGTTYVGARVTDNAAVKSVSLVLSQGVGNVSTVTLVPSAADPTRYIGVLPPLPARKDVEVVVQAVDEHGTLARTGPFTVQAQPPFLQEGDPVLLVFSAVLFVGAIVVWAKMGRRRRRA